MTRPSIITDPLKAFRGESARLINEHFARLAGIAVHTDHAHARKLAVAKAVLDGATPAAPFATEAEKRHLSIREFAQLVVTKAEACGGDAVLARECERQSALLEIESAASIDDLRQVFTNRSLGAPALGLGVSC